MNKEQLHARLKELQVEAPNGATNKELSDLILIAEHPLLTATNKQLQEDFDASLQTIDEATAEIAELQEKLGQATDQANATKGAIFKDGEKSYEFGVKNFRFKGIKYTAEEAVENKELMKQLIEAKTSFLKKNSHEH